MPLDGNRRLSVLRALSSKPLTTSLQETTNAAATRAVTSTSSFSKAKVKPEAIASRSQTEGSAKSFSFAYTALNRLSKKWQAVLYRRSITVVILVDLIFFIASTEPSWKELSGEEQSMVDPTSATIKGHVVFRIVEGVSSTIFLIEYVARWITCVEREKYGKHGPVWGRLMFMVSFASILDILATSSFFINQLLALTMSSSTIPQLTFLRFFRLARIMRTREASTSMSSITRVIKYNSEILTVCVSGCVLLVLTTGILLYYLRPPVEYQECVLTATATNKNWFMPWKKQNDDFEVQDFCYVNNGFESIASTMYLSTLMLTGQGGPEGDLPWYTKFVVLLTSVVSVAMFAIPASMLTWGFEAEAERCAKRAYARAKKQAQRKQQQELDGNGNLPANGDDWSDEDEYSTDEEYQKIIAGEDGSDGDDDQQQQQSIPLAFWNSFQKADTDGSGNINLKEFMELSFKQGRNFSGSTLDDMETLQDRVQKLESVVMQNSEKLDRILELLGSQTKG